MGLPHRLGLAANRSRGISPAKTLHSLASESQALYRGEYSQDSKSSKLNMYMSLKYKNLVQQK